MSRDPREKGLFPPATGLCSISLLQVTPEAHPCHRGQYTAVCAPRRMHSSSHMVFYHIPLLPKFSGGTMCVSIACINCYTGLFKIWCVFVLSVRFVFLTIHTTAVFDWQRFLCLHTDTMTFVDHVWVHWVDRTVWNSQNTAGRSFKK